jgi:hypothetical protein
MSNLFRLCLLALHSTDTSNTDYIHTVGVGKCVWSFGLEFGWNQVLLLQLPGGFILSLLINQRLAYYYLPFFLSFPGIKLSCGWMVCKNYYNWWSFVVCFLDETTILKLESSVLELAVVASGHTIFWVCALIRIMRRAKTQHDQIYYLSAQCRSV